MLRGAILEKRGIWEVAPDQVRMTPELVRDWDAPHIEVRFSRPVRLIPLKKALCRTDRGIASQKEATLQKNARFSTSRCVYSCEGAFVFSSFHFCHSRVNLSLFRRQIQKKQSGITQNPICKCGSPDMLTTSILTDFVGGSRTSFHRMIYSAVSAQAAAENGVFTRLSTRDRNTMPDDRKT